MEISAGKKEFSSVKMVLELCSVDVLYSLAQMRWRLAQEKRSLAHLMHSSDDMRWRLAQVK